MQKIWIVLGVGLISFLVLGCGGSSVGDAEDSAKVTLKAVASKTQSAQLGMLGEPACDEYKAGTDCDGDGGVVTYITPQSFLIAVRQAGVMDENGKKYYFIDESNLSSSQAFDITQMMDLHTTSLPNGKYTNFFVELYYVALKLELYNQGQYGHLRIYFSDDDFPNEGNLGHHQGDITLTDENNTEKGFLAPGAEWTLSNVLPKRFDNGEQLYASSPDSQTGHQRGPFGNDELWNQDGFNQGPNQDKFYLEFPIDMTVNSSSKNITMKFSIKDSWYFEDFNGNGIFGPARDQGHGIIEAGDENSSWAPIINLPQIGVE